MMATVITDEVTLDVYAFIRDYIAEHRLSPSYDEIGAGCYISKSTIAGKLARLEAKGWIVREYNVPRSIRLGEHAPDYQPDEDTH